ncbi:putative mitochondrial protein AtMg00860 [Silene latifolia]|uniref:putative mitochondrial protein AtMg00860 n=1 Tax=Silene latifolia TaxID=37657 RepID=UPI003D77D8A5
MEHGGCVLTAEPLTNITVKYRILREQKLFGKLEKCTFMVEEVAFLGYIVSGRGITVDQDKVAAIQSWPTPKTITEKGEFHWTESAQQSFERIKKLMCETPILKLQDFDQLFEVECDAVG